MAAETHMTKDEMRDGLSKGRALIQEEWAHPYEIRSVDELVSEGVAFATPWEWKDTFQCVRRRITAAPPKATGGSDE